MIRFIIIGIFISIATWLVAWSVGMKTLRQQYRKEYETLNRAVNQYSVTKRNYTVIKNKFNDIRKYRCKDVQKINELHSKFEKRFGSIGVFPRKRTVQLAFTNTVPILFFIFIYTSVSSPPLNNEDVKSKAVLFHQRMEYEKEFNLFSTHLGQKESANNWKAVNQINCIGKYQFSPNTLKTLGYGHIKANEFKTNSEIFPEELQEVCLKLLIELNLKTLKKYENYCGTTIHGIHITRAGLLAGMHLGGAGSVKLFLLSNGKIDNQDANGTKISDYIKEFSIYNL